MATVESQANRLPAEHEHEEERSAEIVAGGSMVEAIAGAAALVLAILGLAGLLPNYLLDIATIAIGVALLFEGGAIAMRYTRMMHDTAVMRLPAVEMGGGMSVEILGGIAGIVLGILALLGLLSLTLTSVAAIVFGATLLLSSGTTMRLNSLMIDHHGWPEMTRRIAREAVQAAASVQVLAGLAVAVLGILALLDLHPLELSLIAMLCMAGSILLSGAAVSGKMLSILRR